MSRLHSTQDMVYSILKESKEARNSDAELYVRVCWKVNPIASNMSFSHTLTHLKEYGLPPFETVRRVRQKLQATHKDLRADDQVEGYRLVNEMTYKEYAKEKK